MLVRVVLEARRMGVLWVMVMVLMSLAMFSSDMSCPPATAASNLALASCHSLDTLS